MRQKGEGQSEREMRKQGDRVTARYREGQSARARDREREERFSALQKPQAWGFKGILGP